MDVAVDPVTGIWRFTLKGHDVEVEPKHGFVKVDGKLHHIPHLQGMSNPGDLQGGPLEAITRLLPARSQGLAKQASRQLSEKPKKPASMNPDSAKKSKSESDKAQQTIKGALPTKEAAIYVGMSSKTLETMRSRGGGPPFVKLGRRVVYRPEDLDSWMANRRRKSTSDSGS